MSTDLTRSASFAAVVMGSLLGSGCATLPAAFDLVVPSPVGQVSVHQVETRVEWTARYGKDPREFAHYPIHLWLDRSGYVDLPSGQAECEAAAALVLPESSGANPPPDSAKVEPLTYPVTLYSAEASWIKAGPPSDAHRARLSNDRCVVFLAVSQGSPDRIAFYDQSGVQIDDYTLPREIPLLVPKRWGWLLVAPIGDTVLFVIWFPIVLVSSITSLF